jgi:hypothetical protein
LRVPAPWSATRPQHVGSSDPPNSPYLPGKFTSISLANGPGRGIDKDMTYGAPPQVVDDLRDERGDIDMSDADDGRARTRVRPRERWSWTTWYGTVTVGVLGVLAMGVVVSAITVVSRLPFGPTGAVVPTLPVTTTTVPSPPPSSVAPIPPSATSAPSAVLPSGPPTIAPTTGSAPPPPPKPSATHPSTTRSEPSSVHPTTHRPFPQETTDFLGPPGTNN